MTQVRRTTAGPRTVFLFQWPGWNCGISDWIRPNDTSSNHCRKKEEVCQHEPMVRLPKLSLERSLFYRGKSQANHGEHNKNEYTWDEHELQCPLRKAQRCVNEAHSARGYHATGNNGLALGQLLLSGVCAQNGVVQKRVGVEKLGFRCERPNFWGWK